MNTSNLRQKFSPDDHLIICIGRTHGSAGTDIGFALADKLKINYYDAEIFDQVLKKMDAEKEDIEDHSNYVEELKGKIAKKQVLESSSRISRNIMDFQFRMLFSSIRVI